MTHGWVVIVCSLFVALPAWSELVRVRVRKAESVIRLSGLGLEVGAQPIGIVSVRLPRVQDAEIRLESRGGRFPIWRVMSNDGSVRRIAGTRLYVGGETLRVGVHLMPQTLELVPNLSGRVDVVANVELEQYLTGVLPSEMPAAWPMEALKAQAVASRSYALALIRERRDSHFHLESTVLDQVFNLNNHFGAEPEVQNKIAQAVRATEGLVLLEPNGRVLKAFYHADCGGRTETGRQVWGEAGFESGTVRDAQCPLSPMAQWQYRLARQDLRDTLASYFGIGPEVAFESLVITGRTPSGRVAALEAVFADREPRMLSSHEFRKLIGFNLLRSTNFTLKWQGSDLVVEGRGHGHGVGLCQYGARQLAKRGLNYREILANYYPKARLGSWTSGPVL